MKTGPYKQRGQILIIFALVAIGLFAIVGLAIDGSKKFSDQRHAQNAADTAALAAAVSKATDLSNNVSNNSPTTHAPATCPPPSGVSPSTVCSNLQVAGLDRADENGYSGNLVSNTVEIYSPPINGPYAGLEDYVQVIITSFVDTTFARVIGINQTKNVVQAVAYTNPGFYLAEGATIISYDPEPNCSTGGTGGYSVEVTGSSTVNLNGGGLFLNSHAVCGFRIPNCADLNLLGGAGIETVGASNIDTAGCTFDPPITKNYNQYPVAIPSDVDKMWPKVPPECGFAAPTPYKFPTQIMGTDGKLHDQWLIYPGFYTDFPQPALVSNKSYIYMASGVYCIDPPMNSDLSWSPVDAAFLNGSIDPSKNPYSAYNPRGVTLYIKIGGGFTINASSPTFLDATNDPHSDYQGYLIILEGTSTTHPSCVLNGGSDIDVNGLIFAPYCDFTINGHAGETARINAQLVGWDIKVNGSNAINFNYDPSNLVKIKRKVGLMR